jgi:beta-glucosidase
MKKLLIVLLMILFIVGCENNDQTPTDPCDIDPNGETCDQLPEEPSIDEQVLEILFDMSLDEKVGQMVQAERSSVTPTDVSTYYIGSILSGGGSHPNAFNNSADVWYQMVYDYQYAAVNSGANIPLIYGTDAIHGHNNLYGATIFPHNIGLGAANDPELVYEISKATAKEMLTTGITWNFAPALSIVQNIGWGRSYEGFSENPEIFESLTQSAIKGYEENGVSATAKHYLADGATTNGIDQGDVNLSEQQLRDIHLIPYLEAIEAGVDTVMISYSSINGVKMHEQTYWIQDVLKDELGFEGFVVSDWNAIQQLSGSYQEQVAKSINAGVDMLMEPYTWRDAIEAIKANVNANIISMDRINDAVSRIIRVKLESGLFEDPYAREDISTLYSEAHQALAREAVRKSLVLLKNDNQSLPLEKNESIYLTGTASDHVGYMSGGWTTYWQGNTSADIGVGTSIKDAMTSVLSENSGQIVNNINDAQTVVVVLSELPYSEGVGDNQILTLTGGNADPNNINALYVAQQAHQDGKNVVGILISGRPLLFEDYLQYFDSFVAAWLPGSEGGLGISDVIFGDYDFTGKLSYTWPKSIAYVGYNSNRENYDEGLVQFPYGYGLTYA